MGSPVRANGSILLDREIVDQLGVQPGWETVQLVRDGHVEVHFLPPITAGGAAGILSPLVKDPAILEDEDRLRAAIEQASGEAAAERFRRSSQEEPR